MKKKCLIVFKWPLSPHHFIVNKLSKFYDTEYIHLSNFKDKNFSETIEEINNLIQLKNIQVVFFDVDFLKFMNFFFVEKIVNVKKVLMSADDCTVHEFNVITANACDLVVTADLLSPLKYKEKGYEAFFMPYESDSGVIKNYNLKKEIDVLFFGRMTSDRRKFLSFIESGGIKVKVVGEDNDLVTEEELAKLISKSKIVLNFSKTTGKSVISYFSEDTYKHYYQLKGRLTHSGLCGTLCISEYSPGQEIMFKDNEIPTFHTKEECVKILQQLLNNEELLLKYTDIFCSKIMNVCEDKKAFGPIHKAIEKKINSKPELITIPYWYLRIAAKQIITRNLNLASFFKSISQFKEIFKIIKNSNFRIKLLIILETSINIIWYSIISTIKNK